VSDKITSPQLTRARKQGAFARCFVSEAARFVSAWNHSGNGDVDRREEIARRRPATQRALGLPLHGANPCIR
jgi:hypothetical protein